MYGKKGKSKKYNGMAMQPAEGGMKVPKYGYGGKIKMTKGKSGKFASGDLQDFSKQPS
tara:strand:+ start:3429 stop:3602 length:174 start_codon:yes stop_codon:yes gene_type:complete